MMKACPASLPMQPPSLRISGWGEPNYLGWVLSDRGKNVRRVKLYTQASWPKTLAGSSCKYNITNHAMCF